MIIGAILAGGQAKRFAGGEKHLADFRGMPLIEHVIRRARPQVDFLALSISAQSSLAPPSMERICDEKEAIGPLGGLAACLDWACDQFTGVEFVAVFPCDMPMLPGNTVERLVRRLRQTMRPAAFATYNGKVFPTLSLWRHSARSEIRNSIEHGKYSLKGVLDRLAAIDCPFDDELPLAFANINTYGDLTVLRSQVETLNTKVVQADGRDREC